MAPRRTLEGDFNVRLSNMENTIHEQLLPEVSDLKARVRIIETWLWRAVGAIGVLSFLASIAIKFKG